MNLNNLSSNLDLLPCGIVEVDKNRIITYRNLYAANLFDDPAGELVGQRLDTAMSAASRIFIDSYIYPLLLNDSVVEEIQLTVQTSQGAKAPVVANIGMAKDKASTWVFMACNNHGKLYDELLSARDFQSAQASKLKRLNNKIQIEHDDLQVFCRSLSHDFTGPVLNAQQLLIFVMADLRALEIDVDDQLELIEKVTRKLSALVTLISGLLEFLTADTGAYERELVDLNKVITVALDLNNVQDGKGVSITVDRLPVVSGNPAQLQLLFKNLISNALKYNEKTPEIAISCDCSSRQDHNIVTIEDNGIGMPPRYLEGIFLPFKRLHSHNKYSGSGLGLSIVRKLVSSHNGEIFVESTVGEGSKFFVTFPVSKQEPHDKDTVAAPIIDTLQRSPKA